MNKAFLYIILGAALWGTIGWYVKNLYEFGFTPMEVVTLRVWFSAVMLGGYLLIASPGKLKLKQATDLKYFLGTGILSIIFFNYCMFSAIELSTIPMATALLYTAPAFVTILSSLLFKEPLTKMKMAALLITLAGTCLVVGLMPWSLGNVQLVSVLFGLGSGLGYAFYSIFSKYALKKYTSLSITAYTFIVASLALLPLFPYADKAHLFTDPKVLFFAAGLGFLPTSVAYIIYTYGLQHTEASKASILSTIEPVVATVIGVFVFQESFSSIQTAGMGLIIGAVILIQLYGSSAGHILPLKRKKTG
ncbi:DMT family transporter [Virgibacillus xinjiangensis]|uniref:DMT family transporter n=1 Tax=Virgibacillus xinjiangensis TaxID=393090 RepID=A0ABV7CUG7_9BACI